MVQERLQYMSSYDMYMRNITQCLNIFHVTVFSCSGSPGLTRAPLGPLDDYLQLTTMQESIDCVSILVKKNPLAT